MIISLYEIQPEHSIPTGMIIISGEWKCAKLGRQYIFSCTVINLLNIPASLK